MTLQIRGISKTYPNGVQALKDVTLTIPKGMYNRFHHHPLHFLSARQGPRKDATSEPSHSDSE